MIEQTLQASFINKFGKEKEKQIKIPINDEKSDKNSKNHSDSTKKGTRNKYSEKEVDMKEFQCYNS